MARVAQSIFVLLTFCFPMVAFIGSAHAESSEGSRIIVFPIRGPLGAKAREKVVDRIDPYVAQVKKLGNKAAQNPARTARMHKADATISGRITCPGKQCNVKLTVRKRTGHVWTEGSEKAPRAKLADTSAELAEALLQEVGLLSSSGDPDEEEEEEEDDLVDLEEQVTDDELLDSFEEPEEEQEAWSKRPVFDAVEVYLNLDLTLRRNLCVDVALDNPANNEECRLDVSERDDRTYRSAVFPSLGFRLNIFPGAFFHRSRWFSHFGAYLDYGHSLVLRSSLDYEDMAGTPFTREIGTTQQDLRGGLMYRLAFWGPDKPQIRVLLGVGFFRFYFDDQDYPEPSELGSEVMREANPYLPTFSYTSLDIGVELKAPFLGFLFPYTSFTVRGTLGSGQAERVFGTHKDSSIIGLDWEIGMRVELPFNIRIGVSFELIWYKLDFDGALVFSPEDQQEQDRWGSYWSDTSLVNGGDFSTDLTLRLRFAVGWAF